MKQLEDTLNKNNKVTNWSMKTVADYDALQKIKQDLVKNVSFIAIKGWLERKEETNSVLHMLLKYEKPTLRSSLFKEIKKSDFIDIDKTTLKAVPKSEDVKTLLETIEKDRNTNQFFEKGNFKFSRSTTKSNPDVHNLIRKYGISKAKEKWVKYKKSYKIFERAEKQFKWEMDVICKKGMRQEAEKRLQNLFPWQDYVYKIFLSTPDDRTIYVVLDKDGGNGKTYLQNIFKDVYPDEVVDVRNGKPEDMKKLAEQGGQFKMLQLNISRQKVGKLCLASIEEIKDGNFASMKYSSKTLRIKNPHVFIYTNTELKWEEMTTERWMIVHLNKEYKNGFETYNWSQWKEKKIKH